VFLIVLLSLPTCFYKSSISHYRINSPLQLLTCESDVVYGIEHSLKLCEFTTSSTTYIYLDIENHLFIIQVVPCSGAENLLMC